MSESVNSYWLYKWVSERVDELVSQLKTSLSESMTEWVKEARKISESKEFAKEGNGLKKGVVGEWVSGGLKRVV